MKLAQLVGRLVVVHLRDGSGVTGHLIHPGWRWVRLRLDDGADLYLRRRFISLVAVEPAKKETRDA